MITYIPKLHHAALAAALCLLCVAAQAYTQKPEILKAWVVGAWLFFFLWLLVVVMLIMGSFNEQTVVQTDWMRQYKDLDEEGRAVMGHVFPTMRYRMKRGRAHPYFEDTFVPIETFQLFLKDSDRLYISPERNWNSAQQPRAMWKEIKEYLEAEGKVVPDSAAGSHSWRWVGNWYDRYCAAYWMVERELRYASTTGSDSVVENTE